jgi:glycosyltransferase involved in cell wall biosynthesis
MGGRLEKIESWLSNASQIEIVLVHDLSDDSTQAELDEILKEYKLENLTLIKGRFGSPGLARNAGFDHVKTEFVTFWDSDDLPNPEEFLNMSKMLKSSNAALCVGEYEIVNTKQRKVKVEKISLANTNQKVSLTPGVWRMVFRTSLIPSNPFTNLMLGEDHIFLQDLNFASMSKLVSNKTVYTYFFAGEANLTSDKRLITELKRAFDHTNNFRRNALSLPELEFSSTILVREAITMLKKGPSRLKIQTARKLSQIFIASSPLERRKLISAFKLILDHKL